MKTSLICLIFLYIICLAGCFSASLNLETKNKSDDVSSGGRLHHIVLCWLKEPGDQKDREKIIEVTKSFMDIPGVLNAQAGQVIMSDREIVDDSFDVGILIVTKNQKDLQKYLDHPIHQQAKKEVLLPLVERILVYDFMD